MMIHVGYELECDLCYERYVGSNRSKQSLLKEAKVYGWTEKHCPYCKRVPAPDKLRKLLAKGLTIEQIADQYYPFEDWLKDHPNDDYIGSRISHFFTSAFIAERPS